MLVCSVLFDVLKLSNVPFPTYYSEYSANFNAPYDKDISEFTICYRYQIESYNDGLLSFIRTSGSKYNLLDRIGWETGYEVDGYQSGILGMRRNVYGGGLGPTSYPIMHIYMLAKNVEPAKWQSICYSYSSSLQKFHMYQNGAKVFSFQFGDERDDPLPSTVFEKVSLLKNFRGLFTDLQIFNTWSPEEAIIQLSTHCHRDTGEIFTWDRNKIKIERLRLQSIL